LQDTERVPLEQETERVPLEQETLRAPLPQVTLQKYIPFPLPYIQTEHPVTLEHSPQPSITRNAILPLSSYLGVPATL